MAVAGKVMAMNVIKNEAGYDETMAKSQNTPLFLSI